MKKNLKILSSLALAGVLATGAMGTTSLAANTNGVETKPVGIYKHIIEGKNIVPFVLSNKDDKITIKDIKDSGKFNMTQFNGSAISDESTVVRTGDTFKADGNDYTVIIYGDVDRNGIVNVLDAQAIVKAGVFDDQKLDEIQQEAANVIRADKSSVNVVDALRIVQYRAEIKDELIDKLPAPEQETNQEDYVVTVNDRNIVNKENETKTTVTIKLNQQLTNAMGNVSIKLDKANDPENPITVKSGITIPAYTSQFTIGNIDENGVATDCIDFSGADEGNVTGKLVAQDGTVLVTFKFEKNTTLLPEVAQVKTERVSTPEAKMSFNSCGESDIVKMYYIVPTDATTFADADTMIKNTATKTMNISNNKLDNVEVTNSLTTNTAYTVYFVVENSYGNRSGLETALITKDGVTVQPETKVKEVKAPTLAKDGETITTANFTWTPADSVSASDRANKKYMVTLLKDGKAVYEEETVAGATSIELSGKMAEPGKYKVSVVVKGDSTGSSKDSDAVESNEVEVTKLNTVTNIQFKVDQAGAKKLSWTSEYRAEDIQGYKVTLINETDNNAKTELGIVTTKEITLSDTQMLSNKIYKAEITTMAKNDQLAKVNAEKATSDKFLAIAPGTISYSSKTENSVTLKITPINLDGVTYDVEVYKVTGDNGDTKPRYELADTKKNLEVKNDQNGNKIVVIEGLANNTAYAFKLIANVSNAKGESRIEAQTTTLKQMPAIQGLEVVAEKDKGTGKIARTTQGGLNINGQDYNDIANYPAELAKVNSIMTTLVVKDKITMSGNKLTLTLPNEASEASTGVRNFGSTTDGMIVEIEGNKFSKTITSDKAKEIILKGTDAIFNIANLKADRVVLSNSVVATTGATNPVTVAAGATVTINNVKVTAQKELTMKANGKELTIDPNNDSNNITFENTTAGNTDIIFKGEDGFGSSQRGTITIKSTDGKVTVKGDKMSVSSELNIEVENGDIDIKDPTLGGNKNIKVTTTKGKDANIEAVSKTKAPDELKGKTVELKTYTTDDEKTALKTALGVADLTDELLQKVQTYINSFGINGKGIELTVGNDLLAVTFAFGNNVEVSNVNISNIK